MGNYFFHEKGGVTMGKLIEEVQEWNTPIVGAYLLWRFTKSFIQNNLKGDAPIVAFHFLVSGIMTEPNICNSLSGRRSNLPSFVRWFNEEKRSDLLACLSQQILKQRNYTMKSIDIAVSSGLLAWDVETAKIYSTNISHVKKGTATMGISVQNLGDKAEVLGKWFSEYDLHAVAAYLGVVL
jgi:hypothetical protein